MAFLIHLPKQPDDSFPIHWFRGHCSFRLSTQYFRSQTTRACRDKESMRKKGRLVGSNSWMFMSRYVGIAQK